MDNVQLICSSPRFTPTTVKYQGCIKLPFSRIMLLGKKIKWGRREGKREEGKGNGRGKKGKGRKWKEKEKGSEIEENRIEGEGKREERKWEGGEEIKLVATLYTPALKAYSFRFWSETIL